MVTCYYAFVYNLSLFACCTLYFSTALAFIFFIFIVNVVLKNLLRMSELKNGGLTPPFPPLPPPTTTTPPSPKKDPMSPIPSPIKPNKLNTPTSTLLQAIQHRWHGSLPQAAGTN